MVAHKVVSVAVKERLYLLYSFSNSILLSKYLSGVPSLGLSILNNCFISADEVSLFEIFASKLIVYVSFNSVKIICDIHFVHYYN